MPDAALRIEAGRALACCDLEEKAHHITALRQQRATQQLPIGTVGAPIDVAAPGRPEALRLVAPRDLPRRRTTTVDGRIATLHALAHIEANAVNLALDAVHRFDGLPDRWYDDWLGVAEEEAAHHRMLVTRLADHGAAYGDLPAHDGLWQAAIRTADDPMVRMALVPRVLEARGLDVTPGLRRRFDDAGDDETTAVLDVILRDEVGHVAIGSRWFRWLCEQRSLAPHATFRSLLVQAGVRIVPPLNLDARRRAGFDEVELAGLATA